MTPTSHAAACAVLTSLAQPQCTAIVDSLLRKGYPVLFDNFVSYCEQVIRAHRQLRAKHLADVLIVDLV
eukprot:19210-Heterococcus_DN1.PRE.1